MATKKSPEEKKDGIAKYAFSMCAVAPEDVHPILKAEIDKYMNKT